MDRSLEELVRYAKTGDMAATTELLNASSGIALNWARQMVGDETMAQNIAQNSLVSAISNLAMLQDPSRYESWLYSIVSSNAASFMQAAAAQGQSVYQANPQQGPQGQPTYQANPQQGMQPQAGGKKNKAPKQKKAPAQENGKGSGKKGLIAVAVIALLLICLGGGLVAGRVISQRLLGNDDSKTAAETEADTLLAENDIPAEGIFDDENAAESNTSFAEGDNLNGRAAADGYAQAETGSAEANAAAGAESSASAGTSENESDSDDIKIILNESDFDVTTPETGSAADQTAGTSRSVSSSGSTDINVIAQWARTTNGGYILPESNSRYYTASELNVLNSEELRIARNEIYARRGRMFDSDDLNAYFNSMPWYHGTISPSSFKDSVFNDYEKKNIDAVKAAEARK